MAIHCNRRGSVHRYTSHVIFLMHFTRVWWCESHHMAQDEPLNVSVQRASPRILAIHDERLSVCSSLSLRSDSLRVSLLHLALLFPLLPVLWPELLLVWWITPRQSYPAPPPTEESCSLAEYTPPTPPHSLFLLPLPKNTQHNRDNTIISKNTQDIMHISMISQSTSSAIKNHSGVKTCRVAETRARQLPQVMSPKILRLSRGSKIILEIHINILMHRNNLEKKCTELRSPKKWRDLCELGHTACRIIKYQKRPTSNRRCMSTIP